MVESDRTDRTVGSRATLGYEWDYIGQSHVSYVVQWDRMDREIQNHPWVYKWDSIAQSHLSYVDTGDGGQP